MHFKAISDLPSYPPAIAPLDPDAYRLTISGAVSTPLQLSLADLQALPPVTVTADFACLEGWVAMDRSWQGVALATVLHKAGLNESATHVAVWAADHGGEYNAMLTREQALSPTAVLALARQGQTLTHPHGAPVRLQVPGADCFTQVKWVVKIEALTEPIQAKGKEIALDRLKQLKAQGLR